MSSTTCSPIDLERLFQGRLVCHGVIVNRSGTVTKRFTAHMTGSWHQDDSPVTGTLAESFRFDDGTRLDREWHFTRTGSQTYSGTASDIEGKARLTVREKDIFMGYRLKLPFRNKHIVLTADDRLWCASEGVIMNRSILKKFGCRVAEIISVIMPEKQEGAG